MMSVQEPAQPIQHRELRLRELLAGYVDVSSDQDRPIRELALHSRYVKSGDVFFAMAGDQSDGRAYIDEALAREATAVVYEKAGANVQANPQSTAPMLAVAGLRDALGPIASRYFGFPSKQVRVLGVTGTNGKTTVAYLIAQALDYLGMPCAYFGTVGAGRIENLRHADLTTMDSIGLQRNLAQLARSQIPAASMEVSSHGLDQGRVNGVEFEVGIFTNLTHDHLDYHGTFEQYSLAKRKLFEYPSLLAMVVNADDAFGREIVKFCHTQTEARCVTYGFNQNVDLHPRNIVLGTRGTTFEIDLEGVSARIESTLIGRLNLGNLLAAIGALQAFGMSPHQIAAAIRQAHAPPGRMELFDGGDRFPSVVVDYAHTPDALENALCSLRELCDDKLVVVFGCGGDRDNDKRPLMGAVAEQYADQVILTNDNPRSEPPQQIHEDILRGMQSSPEVYPDRGQAIRLAIEQSNRQDLVLVAGKGHERDQLIGDEVLEFDDSTRVKMLLEGRR